MVRDKIDREMSIVTTVRMSIFSRLNTHEVLNVEKCCFLCGRGKVMFCCSIEWQCRGMFLDMLLTLS